MRGETGKNSMTACLCKPRQAVRSTGQAARIPLRQRFRQEALTKLAGETTPLNKAFHPLPRSFTVEKTQ
ncbi:MAG: hypothetical protein PHH59_09920 [Methylovulum sp.]|uniref:hypothetical protein n=1 Tax=Methylovulum sp. TaxID=1916980 RepID=UPI00262220EF|nr:hypothetical protein [Methylovulum sp.]MDD2724323.1 hypothetical protein [Methylovulum sp.]